MPNINLPPPLTESNYIYVVTGAYAIIIDRKTGEVVGVVPEMPTFEGNVFTAATEFLRRTEGVKEAAELRLEAGKFVAKFVEKAVKQAAAKTVKAVA